MATKPKAKRRRPVQGKHFQAWAYQLIPPSPNLGEFLWYALAEKPPRKPHAFQGQWVRVKFQKFVEAE